MKLTYFAQNLKHLRRKSSITQEQLGNEVNLGRTTIANYESGVSSPTDTDILVKFSHLFQVSIDELLTKDLSMAFSNNIPPAEKSLPLNASQEALQDFIKKKRVLYESTIKKGHYMGIPKVIVVDTKGDEKMAFVPITEIDHYLERRDDPSYISSLPCYSLPRFSKETYRMFEVNSHAMEPKFSYADKIVANWIANAEDIKDGNVYVIVAKDHGVLIRRVLNKIKDRNTIQLIADTIKHGSQYPLIELLPEEIQEIWSAEYVISSNLAQPAESVYGKIADLEIKVQELMQSQSQQKNNSPNES